MLLQELLLKNPAERHFPKVIDWLEKDSKNWEELIELFLKGNYKLNRRASLLFKYCALHHPDVLQPYLKKFVLKLYRPMAVGLKRNTLRFLAEMDMGAQGYEKLVACCFRFLASKQESIAVKVYSMMILYKASHHFPDLRPELKIILEDGMDCGSPAYRSRAGKILKMLQGE